MAGDYHARSPVPGSHEAEVGLTSAKCSVKDCACGGRVDDSETHDTGFRLGPPGLSFPIFVSTSIPDPPGWIMVSGDWKL